MKTKALTAIGLAALVATGCPKPFFDISCAQSMTSDAGVAGNNEVVGINYIASCKAHQGSVVHVGHRVFKDNASVAFIIYESGDLNEIKVIRLVDYKNDGNVDTITVEEKTDKKTALIYYKGPEYMRDNFEQATCTGLSEYLSLNTRNVCAESVSEYDIRQVAAREMKADDNFGIAETEVGVVLDNIHDIPRLYSVNTEQIAHTTLDFWFNTADNLQVGLRGLSHDEPQIVQTQAPEFTQTYSADIATLLSISAIVINYKE